MPGIAEQKDSAGKIRPVDTREPTFRIVAQAFAERGQSDISD